MAYAMELESMAKTKGRPRRSERDDVSAKLDRAIVGKAKLIATHRGVPVAELLSEMLDAPVDRAYAAMLRELDSKGDRAESPAP